MSNLTEELAREEERIFDFANFSTEVVEAMRVRCEKDGHEPVGCCTESWRAYMRCRWCGKVLP